MQFHDCDDFCTFCMIALSVTSSVSVCGELMFVRRSTEMGITRREASTTCSPRREHQPGCATPRSARRLPQHPRVRCAMVRLFDRGDERIRKHTQSELQRTSASAPDLARRQIELGPVP